MAALGSLVKGNFSKVPVSVIQVLNQILYGRVSSDRASVLNFKKFDPENIENAENMLATLDGTTLNQISEIFSIEIDEQSKAADEIFQCFYKFGLDDNTHKTEVKLIETDTQISPTSSHTSHLLEQEYGLSTQQVTQQAAQQLTPQVTQQLAQHQLLLDLQQQVQQLTMQLKHQVQQTTTMNENYFQPAVSNINSNNTFGSNKDQHNGCGVNATSPTIQPTNICGSATSLDVQKLITRQILGNDLPTFDGNNLEWPTFITEYNRSTRECGFSDAENIIRLRKCLGGKARSCVDMLLYTSEATRVIEVLRRNFGRSEVIIDQVVEKIHKLPPVTDSNSFLEFVNFLENVNVILINFGNEHGQFHNRFIVKQLIMKLPDYMRVQCANFMSIRGIEFPSLDQLSTWANSQHETTRLFEIGSPATSKQNRNSGEEKQIEKKDVADSKQTRHPQPSDVSGNKNCKICRKGEHQVDKCQEFLKADVKNRWTIARQAHACYTCLKRHHGSCNNRTVCGVNGCDRFHHKLLHKAETQTTHSAISSTITQEKQTVILKMIPITIKGPKGQREILAFMDEGSTVSMIDTSVTEMLGIDGPTQPLCCTWTGNITRSDATSQLVSLDVVKSSTTTFTLERVHTFNKLQLPKQNIDIASLNEKYPYTKQAKIINSQPLMLIGQDNCDLIVSRDSIQPDRDSPMLTLTKLGWVVHGPANGVNVQTDEIVSVNVCCDQNLDDLDDFVKKQMSLENFGVVVTSIDRQKSEEERKAILIAESSIKKLHDRYELALPYKYSDQQMVDSYKTAFRRLQCTERKIVRDDIADGYKKAFDNFIEKGYATKVHSEELAVQRKNIWFLPHFPVLNQNKPGKIRLVFDAAAKSNGQSLNDYLLTGPDMVPSLFGVLSRFRENPVAVCADIVEMFPQVRIREDDSWSQCFLWRDLETSRQPDTYRMNSMIFGATSSPFMAQFVKNYNAEKYRDEYPAAVEAVVRQHYVDDFIESIETVEEAARIVEEVIFINKQAGFQLRGFVSNFDEALEHLPNDVRASKNLLNFDEEDSHRVLGVRWDPLNDTFVFRYNFNRVSDGVMSGTKTPTKREVLRVAMSVFDPIGFLSPLTITTRIILQNIWKSGIGWDDEIPATLSKKWCLWLNQLATVDAIKFPRCFVRDRDSKLELHIFCDASESAYASVVYLRAVTSNDVNVSFVASKARVTPIKNVTIPRLELIAAVLGVRLALLIKKELRIHVAEEHYWSDSKTVLAWIRTNKKLTSFISSRVGEIVESTSVSSWKWVPTKLNPADKATRENLTGPVVDEDWINGPKFLQYPIEQWPTEDKYKDEAAFQSETVSECIVMSMECILTSSLHNGLPDPTRASSYQRLIGATAVVLRFLSWRKNQPMESMTSARNRSEELWYRAVQQLFTKRFLVGIEQYSPFFDADGLLRVGGRLDLAMSLAYDVRHPIILDDKHPFVRLLVQRYHQKCMHQGRETVINMLRQKFYFPKMRAVVKSVIHECQYCITRSKLPHPPFMGSIPDIRLSPNLPIFTYVGIDFFGPMMVKIGKRHEKRWGVIFTCMVSRAIHLEITSSLSGDYAIMVLRRFLARRGTPRKIFCDNGTNLRGAESELKRAIMEIQDDAIQQFTSMEGIQWQFIPPSSPNFGGCWERLIRTVKTALSAVLVEKCPKEETLHTFLVEVENVVNNRPITFVSTDPNDSTAITPNMLIKGRDEIQIIPGRFERRDELLRKQWRISQHWVDVFWDRWIHEYIPQLLPRKKWLTKYDNLQKGDVVRINEPNYKRGAWPLGRVVNAYPGADGVVRVVDVLTKHGILKRPASKVVPVVLAEGEEAIGCIDDMESIPGGRNVTAKNISLADR